MKKRNSIFKLTYLTIFTFFFVTHATIDFNKPISVSLSPQKNLEGYIANIVLLIDKSNTKLDIALYGFEDFDIYNALKRATQRGVQVRMLYEGAVEDRKKIDSTMSHTIEKLGIDIRYINKINHHKFMISDNRYLVTSSGNWNSNANSMYDENTLWIKDDELVLKFRAEFELLWNNSREFGLSFPFSSVNTNPDSLLQLITDNPDVDVVFTSSNYRTYISSTYGPTFAKITGRQNVADRLVQLINNAHQSIDIASTHIRSGPIAEALIAKKISNPSMLIRVYLDDEEYISEEYNQIQLANREECLAQASTPGQRSECLESDFYYSYELLQAGIEVRFKTYSYKWDLNTSPIMHHKYAIFDNTVIATGSYNYSYNAETNSMENLVIFNTSFSSETVSSYSQNFESIWNTGRIEGFLSDILSFVNSHNRYIPTQFPSMALEYNEVRLLKQNIESVCPEVQNQYFKNNSAYLSVFPKGCEFILDSSDKLISINDSSQHKFTLNYTYNAGNELTSESFHSSDNLQLNNNYTYNSDSNLAQLVTPRFNIHFTYDTNSDLTLLNAGQGLHTWNNTKNSIGTVSSYSTPSFQNYLVTQWDSIDQPLTSTDADNRIMQWTYDTSGLITSIRSGDRAVNFLSNDSLNTFEINSTNIDKMSVKLNYLDSLSISLDGTVKAELQYTLNEQPDKYTQFGIQITSGHVSSGVGKQAAVGYLLDPYSRVVRSGNVNITREPYSGNISTITCNNITETRSYNEWGLLDTQRVKYANQVYYEALYEYDGLQRIKTLHETVLDTFNSYEYEYSQVGCLTTVYKKGTVNEQYSYDSFGNRLLFDNDYTYNYSYNINRLNEYYWQLSDRTRKVTFAYNNCGQLLTVKNKTITKSSQSTTSEKNYSYDVFGNLNNVAWADQTEKYKYDPYDRQIATFQNDNLKNSLIYGFGISPLARMNENGRITDVFIYEDKNVPIAMVKGSVEYYFISDIRGSLRMVVKSTTGEIRQKISYNSFGKTLEDSNPGYTPFGFAGGLYDYRTGLIRFGARDYLPEIGRWTCEDPIGFLSGDINFYAYVGNDPINYVDPTGLSQSGGQVQWNNGWRTSNGKFASPLNSNKSGADAEKAVWDRIISSKVNKGWELEKGRVYAKNSKGDIRVYDGAVKSPSQNWIGLEIKSGSANKTPYQKAFDSGVSSSNPAKGIGQNDGLIITKTLLIRE